MNMTKYRSRSAGFTLVEVALVVTVLAILATIVVMSYRGVQNNVAVTSMKADLDTVASQLGVELRQTGTYPDNLQALNSGAGVSVSENSSLQYFKRLDGTYCITATSTRSGVSMLHKNSTDPQVGEGACPGSLNGAVVTTVPNTGNPQGQGSEATSLATDSNNNVYILNGGLTSSVVRKLSPNGTVALIAGSTSLGYVDGPGLNARFSRPTGIAATGDGTLYIADASNNRIRKISPSGVVSTFAGSGVAGSTNGVGTAAQFTLPQDVAVDSNGTVYVADGSPSNRIRKITPDGTVTTLAGSGTYGYQDGAGATARFRNPRGIAVDAAGMVYVADTGSHRIRKITPAGVVSTHAGTGTAGTTNGAAGVAQFDEPYDLTIDNYGIMYVTDSGNHRIRKITFEGVVSTLAGSTQGTADGTATAALFNFPKSIAVDSNGVVYVGTTPQSHIRKIE